MSEEDECPDVVGVEQAENGSPRSKQPSPLQGMYRPSCMAQAYHIGSRLPGIPPMGLNNPFMRGPRVMNMRGGPPVIRHHGMSVYRGPIRPFDCPPTYLYEMPHRLPPIYPPQSYPSKVNETIINNENMDSYYARELYIDEYYQIPRGPPRGFGPPVTLMCGSAGSRLLLNGGPTELDMGLPGYGPRPCTPGHKGGQSGYSHFTPEQSQQCGILQQANVLPSKDITVQEVDNSSPLLSTPLCGPNQGPLTPTDPSSNNDAVCSWNSDQLSDMRQTFTMAPYGPPQITYRSRMPSMQNGPQEPFIPFSPRTMPPGAMRMFNPPQPNHYRSQSDSMSSRPRVPRSLPGRRSNTDKEIWIEHDTVDGKTYYYNMSTRETRWDRPDNVTVLRQGGAEKPSMLVKSQANLPPNFSVVTPRSLQYVEEHPLSTRPKKVFAWTEYQNEERKSYFHNSVTGQTTWDKPPALVNWECGGMTSSDIQNTTLDTSVAAAEVHNKFISTESRDRIPQTQYPEKSLSDPLHCSAAENPIESKKEREFEPRDNSRPISSTAVTGTPWCVVWTGDERVFFFNPSRLISVWETPGELKGRSDVDKLLKEPPNDKISYDNKIDTDKAMVLEDPPTKKSRLNESVKCAAAVHQKSFPSTELMMGDGAKSPIRELVGMNVAKEAYEKAAKDQAGLPLEVRLRQFRGMLSDKQVSAFSTWDKELHKIVFDQRYLLLNCEERKQAFEVYVKEQAEYELRENKSKLKEKKDKFHKLLNDAGLTSKSSFSNFASKYSRDERFKEIEKLHERESLFQTYLSNLRRQDREITTQKEKVKTKFTSLLEEQNSISRRSHWSDVKKIIDTDPRYLDVDSPSRREEWFREYIEKLTVIMTREDGEKHREREKHERRKEVDETRSHSMRERDRGREVHLHREAEDNFKALLTDTIKTGELSWKGAKTALRKDSRWNLIVHVLSASKREALFDSYKTSLDKKAKEAFIRVLNTNDLITYWTSWKEVKNLFKNDSLVERFSSNEKTWRSDFSKWAVNRESQAKSNFLEMLQEKASLLSTAKNQSSGNDNRLDYILSILKTDIRYSAVEPSQCTVMLKNCLEHQLDSDGR